MHLANQQETTHMQHFMAKADHPNTVPKNDSTAFLYLLDDSANKKYVHCSMLDPYSVQWRRHEL